MQIKNNNNKKPAELQHPIINLPELPRHEQIKLELSVRKISGVTLGKPYNLNRTTAAISRALAGEKEFKVLLDRIILFINRFDKKINSKKLAVH